ncbi:serine/threonine-protein kinase [Shewanella avicenniae]|uniref:Serine/threonine-protein kinase n=1 Tax=Shewanella avicenniae TaxID=2814294 RepID=A0ABX7QS41_9GAMM|nr:leucine-rich repeat-containing protein kinase family protein [Shewanella avicenniae]QSX34262.1 serine/threonine-protein kinase [Shewanella avicenniae]
MHTLEQLRAGALQGISRLTLRCGLTEFPQEIFSLADSLEILDLSGNQLSSLPDDLPRLSKLKVIFCSENNFTELPEVLGRCESLSMVGFKSNQITQVAPASLPPQLRWLILTDNCVQQLPDNLGDCPQLQKLMLAGNQLTHLPDSLAHCHKLELIRLAANQLNSLPQWLFSLPRLTWLAYAGNPFTAQLEAEALNVSLPAINWQQLAVNELLGEGASGLIYRADLSRAETTTPVAVKLFKGAMTSDGLPQCEMASTIKAGQHPALTQTLGRLTEHPDATDGLVMQLIPSDFSNLAGPPSLASCTRDVYASDRCFTPAVIFNIASAIASAAAHLHQQGMMHGDLYGHNILTTETGDALLSDYGAASFYDTANAELAARLARLEVRAFGCLLEELVDRCYGLTADAHQQLSALVAACLGAELMARPTFEEVCERLIELQSQQAIAA